MRIICIRLQRSDICKNMAWQILLQFLSIHAEVDFNTFSVIQHKPRPQQCKKTSQLYSALGRPKYFSIKTNTNKWTLHTFLSCLAASPVSSPLQVTAYGIRGGRNIDKTIYNTTIILIIDFGISYSVQSITITKCAL